MTSPGSSAPGEFAIHHIEGSDADRAAMLTEVGYPTLAALVNAAAPSGVRSTSDLNLPAAPEAAARAELRRICPLTQCTPAPRAATGPGGR
ncbi:hypothetical protein OH786_31435 [Streptomyces atratus]|uniref:Glycine cleavage system P-protein n=1 Tax=Streptomyces atratus TaxID=1893 RepID=A0A1K2FAS8_STRAR|nr:hypothetical protein [Streptomyces atratus]SFY44835.1 Glycine cleavage system P-protein [Streptomyces atratus]